MYQHLLVTTDGSQLSSRSIVSAIELAKSVGARVTGLHVVVDTLVAAGIGKSLRGPDEPVKAAEQYLHEISHRAALAGVPCECAYAFGTWAHEEIVKATQTKGCDLIHMASQGKGMIAGLFLGSETSKVVAKGKVPVLVYR